MYSKGLGKYNLKNMVTNDYPLSQSHYRSHTTKSVVQITGDMAKMANQMERLLLEKVLLLCTER